jgi:hypothetical protein
MGTAITKVNPAGLLEQAKQAKKTLAKHWRDLHRYRYAATQRYLRTSKQSFGSKG